MLGSKSVADRLRAAESLSTHDKAEASLLLGLLRDQSHYVAAIAARKFAENPPDGLERELLSAYLDREGAGAKGDPGCHIRTHLALALGKLSYHPAVEALRRGIRTVQLEQGADTAVGLRGNCALALSQLAPVDVVLDLAILLYDGVGDPLDRTLEARKAAARALGRTPDAAAIIPLGLKLTEPGAENAEVLSECMDALSALGHPRATELLSPHLDHRDQHLAARAGLAIAKTGDESAPALLMRACDRLRGDPLRAIALGLSAMRTDEAQSTLRELCHHLREEVRLAAIEAVAGTRDADTRAVLELLSREDGSPAVRRAAAIALGP